MPNGEILYTDEICKNSQTEVIKTNPINNYVGSPDSPAEIPIEQKPLDKTAKSSLFKIPGYLFVTNELPKMVSQHSAKLIIFFASFLGVLILIVLGKWAYNNRKPKHVEPLPKTIVELEEINYTMSDQD